MIGCAVAAGRPREQEDLKGSPLQQGFRWLRNGYGGNASWRCRGRHYKAGVMRPVPLRRDYICNASSKPAKRRRNARLVNQQIADPRPADIERRRRPAAIIDG